MQLYFESFIFYQKTFSTFLKVETSAQCKNETNHGLGPYFVCEGSPDVHIKYLDLSGNKFVQINGQELLMCYPNLQVISE